MKKIRLLLLMFFAVFALPIIVNAASGSVTISSTNKVVVGNKVTVTVTLSSDVSIGSWSMSLDYDSNYLQLTSSSTEFGGNKMVDSVATGVSSKKYTFTFQAKKSGSTNLKISNYEAYATDESAITLSTGSKTISIITQKELEASYSKDNNLKALEVEGFEITPEFKKDVLDYSVTVPEGTKTVNIKATKNDSRASVSGAGEVELVEGANNLKIVVRAENGSEKTYNLIVNVIDEHPINVSDAGVDYTVIKLRENYTCPPLYNESEVTIGEFTIPACHNDKTNYTLVGLKDSEGKIVNFIYNNGKYTKYKEIVGTSLNIVILNYDGKLDKLTKANVKIDGQNYEVFRLNDNSKFYVVYGMNVATGQKDFYTYDTVNKTFTLYNKEFTDAILKQNNLYFYVIIVFGVGLFLSLICIISLSLSKKKTKKPMNDIMLKEEKINKKDKKKEIEEIKEEKSVNDIEVDEEDEEEYNILEEDKKRKKRKRK